MNIAKNRAHFVNNASVGNIVAFSVKTRNGTKSMFSGKIEKVNDKSFTIMTKNGSVFYVKKSNVVWVKTGSKWPIGIYNALKYNKEDKKHEKSEPRTVDGGNDNH